MKSYLRQYYRPVVQHGIHLACMACGFALVETRAPQHAESCPVDRLESLGVMVTVAWDASSIGDATSVYETEELVFANEEEARAGIAQWSRDRYGNIPSVTVKAVHLVDHTLDDGTRDRFQAIIVDVQTQMQAAAVLVQERKRAVTAMATLRKNLPGISPMERVTRISSALILYEKSLTEEDVQFLHTTLRENVPMG
jgi:hypothetical protein